MIQAYEFAIEKIGLDHASYPVSAYFDWIFSFFFTTEKFLENENIKVTENDTNNLVLK